MQHRLRLDQVLAGSLDPALGEVSEICAVNLPDQKNGRDWPNPCPLTLSQTETADCTSSFLAEQRLPVFARSLKLWLSNLVTTTCKGMVKYSGVQDWGAEVHNHVKLWTLNL